MWQQLEAEIIQVCRAKIRSHERRKSALAADVSRRSRRSTNAVSAINAQLPDLWIANPNLNPFSVIRRSTSLAHGIRRSIASGSYEPHPPTTFKVQKSGGSDRSVFTFEIADEAVSRLLFRSLHRKNRSLFGAHTYAYREDVGIYDAIRYVASEWSGRSRLFVAEYDLKAYFDSIRHDYLFALLDDRSIHATPLEVRYCKRFVNIHPQLAGECDPDEVDSRGALGIPQGTTISLFLANLAMLPLDRQLEKIGAGFTRYADDILLWSDDYGTACRGVNALYEWSESAGVKVNLEKSRGLRLMVNSPKPQAEFQSIESVDYLGHRIGLTSVRPKASRISQIRAGINKMIFATLLKEPMRGSQRMTRVLGGLDRDYVSLIWQLRRRLYGHLTERQVHRLRRGFVPHTGLSGVVAQFPVVSDRADFNQLDAWIRRQVWLALRRRASILGPEIAPHSLPDVWSLPIERLVLAQARSATTGQTIDLTMPSASLMAEVVERSIQLHGPSVVRGSSRLYLAP